MAKAQIPSKLDATKERLKGRLKGAELTVSKMLWTLSVLANSSGKDDLVAKAVAAGILLFYSRIEKDDLEKQLQQLPPEAPPRRK